MKPLAVTPLGTFYLLCYFYFLICYNTFVKAVPYCPKFTLYPSFLNFSVNRFTLSLQPTDITKCASPL